MKTVVNIAVIVILLCLAVNPVFAIYEVSERGDWPTTWSQKLEPLRKQSRTLVGPSARPHYAIRFSSREEFEAAWPEIIKLKSPGAPIVLVRAPNFFLGKDVTAGVIIHSPPPGQENNSSSQGSQNANTKNDGKPLKYTTDIELVVDDEIVDVKRLELPPDTKIIDERFDDIEGSDSSSHDEKHTAERFTEVADEDPQMNAAIKKARSTLVKFIVALKKPKRGQSLFAIKKMFTDDGYSEHIWLSSVTYDGTTFTGVVDNKPEQLKSIKVGQKVTVAPDEISDWMYVDKRKLVGGETLRVLRNTLTPSEQVEFDKNLPFSID